MPKTKDPFITTRSRSVADPGAVTVIRKGTRQARQFEDYRKESDDRVRELGDEFDRKHGKLSDSVEATKGVKRDVGAIAASRVADDIRDEDMRSKYAK